MVKVTYEFDFYEDREDLKTFQQAIDMSIALDDIYNKIRSELKHGSIEMSDEVEKFIEEIHEMSGEFMC